MTDLSLFASFLWKAGTMTAILPGVFLAVLAEAKWPYVYRWSRYLGMAVLGGARKGQACRVLVRGGRNSCLIEFPDGYQAVTSRNALRRKA
jgi:hypothetical protein